MGHALLHLVARYGYAGIVCSLALGVIGLPVPDEVVLTFSGYMVNHGKLGLVPTILSGWIGGALGITFSYVLGSRLGLPFLLRFGPRLHIPRRRIEWTHRVFERYGSVLLIVGFFIPGVRHVVGYLSGISELNYRKFAVFSYSGALLWSCTFVILGTVLEREWLHAHLHMHGYWKYAFAVAALAVGTFLFMKFGRGGGGKRKPEPGDCP